MKIQKEDVHIAVKDIIKANQEAKQKKFNEYTMNLQDTFRKTITNICLHQGYLITNEIDFLYKTSEIENENITNSKKLALEIKENIDIVKDIKEINYNKKEYFANAINKLNTFINETENSIHSDYYKALHFKNNHISSIRIALIF